MARDICSALMIMLALSGLCCAQSLTYARYHSVVSIDTCSMSVTTRTLPDVQPGDQVLLHQTQTDSASHAEPGTFSVYIVEAVAGTEVYLKGDALSVFDEYGTLQMVPVVEGEHAVIGSTTVPAFNGEIGGVFAVVADTVSLRGSLDATGSGFRGGRMSLAGWDTSRTDSRVPFESAASGQAGESFHVRLTSASGRSRIHSGGGGGNARNAGGGGGGQTTQGGRGGHQTSEYPRVENGGEGGRGFENVGRLLFGGGGGGGHQNDFLGSDGAQGGGAVLIMTKVLFAEAGSSINVSGQNAATALVDGAGGGGGGGTIMIHADTIIGDLHLVAQGGEGGSVIGRTRCYGPGGGGAGGHVITNITAAIDVSGGDPGMNVSTGDACQADPSFGAMTGELGMTSDWPFISNPEPTPCAIEPIIVRGVDTAASPGDQIGIPIEIVIPSGLSRDVLLEVTIKTRATVLVPLRPYWWAGSKATRVYSRRSLRSGPARTETISLPYHVALGDSVDVVVQIDSAWSDDADVQIERHGRFTTLGVCETINGHRLFTNTSPSPSPPKVYNVRGEAMPINGWYPLSTTLFGSRGSVLLVPR